MNAPPLPPRRRGACPALSTPMATGDGLLVRLMPESGLTPAQLAGLAAAAARHGNGIVEVTARGSLQIRGLAPETVDPLNKEVAVLAIRPREGLAIDVSPLSGQDAAELEDGRVLRDRLRAGLAAAGHADRLGPKVSVVIDGGGRVRLDGLGADIRLTARGSGLWALALAGDEASAQPQGVQAADAALGCALGHLARLARIGPDARMADLLPPGGAPARVRPAPTIPPGVPIPLRGGRFGLPLALPFGALDAAGLAALAEAAGAHGADAVLPAPPRLLLISGLSPESLPAVRTAARELGLIGEADDPRLFVSACPGAPACASGHLPARRLADDVARRLAPWLDGSFDLHVSGCAKGCAHPAPAALALVGIPHPASGGAAMDSAVALVRNGKADAAPAAILDLPRLGGFLDRVARMPPCPGESHEDRLNRLVEARLESDA